MWVERSNVEFKQIQNKCIPKTERRTGWLASCWNWAKGTQRASSISVGHTRISSVSAESRQTT